MLCLENYGRVSGVVLRKYLGSVDAPASSEPQASRGTEESSVHFHAAAPLEPLIGDIGCIWLLNATQRFLGREAKRPRSN